MNDQIALLYDTVKRYGAQIIAVSKSHSPESIKRLYDQGIRDFGENRVQELMSKKDFLPGDIRWHMIGHLQKNKVKHIAPFIHCIHSVDNAALLATVEKEGKKNERIINILLQIKIAREQSKFGATQKESEDMLAKYAEGAFPHVRILGMMGMASFTGDKDQIRSEFKSLASHMHSMNACFGNNSIELRELSMGMSGDFDIALEEGATMVRIGTLIFGPRH